MCLEDMGMIHMSDYIMYKYIAEDTYMREYIINTKKKDMERYSVKKQNIRTYYNNSNIYR